MHRISVPVVAVVAAAFVVLGAGRAAAQDATPAAGPAAGIACTVEPRPVDELLAFWFGPEGTPLATPLPASPVAAEAALPEGEPADEETVGAVNATLQELATCFETNQFARAFALMTDDLVRQFGPQQGETLEQARDLLEAQLAVTPVPGVGVTAVPPLRDVRILDDGRAGAVLEEEGMAVFVLFERQDDRWLLDGFIDVGREGGTAGAATPAS